MTTAITLDDILNKWDSQAVLNVYTAFQGIASLNDDSARVIEHNLYGLNTWDGDTAQASKHAIGKTVADVKKQASGANAIALAFRKASNDIEPIQNDIRNLINTAPDYIVIDQKTNIAAINPEKTGGVITPEMKTTLNSIQGTIDRIIDKANSVDEELAHAINLADGDPTTPTNPASTTDPQHPNFVPLTHAMLKQIFPDATDANIDKYLPYLNSSMKAGGIDTPQREAAFLAQLGEESGELRVVNEMYDGDPVQYFNNKYKPPTNGNKYPGDGYKYRGRGLIQITGRDTYQAIGKILGLDLVNHPDYASSSPEAAVAVSVAFWQWKNEQAPLMRAADKGDIRYVSYLVNGSDPADGLENREQFYQNALRALHVR